jgi:hypothetical protein
VETTAPEFSAVVHYLDFSLNVVHSESDKSSESHSCRTMSHPPQSRPGHNRLVILHTIG